jgi:serine/threonine protein kinase
VATLDRYELIRPLARGGMADVFLARRRVAGIEKRLIVKRLRRDHRHDPRFLEMFVREAELSMSLVHQNIVPVFDFGRIGDDVFIAMEHIVGKDLGSTLARDRTIGMPPLLAAFIAHECSEALDYAHRRPDGVSHRDVTPRNVLLSWAGEVKLTDFGIATVVGEAPGAFGTPGYMAPEQANALRCDARVDIYALGIVLWESLTGTHVRPTGDRARTLEAARTGALPPLSDKIPAPLAAIITRATSQAPADRFASAREMADALDAYIVSERTRSTVAKPSSQLADWLRARWGDEHSDAWEGEALRLDDAFVTFLDHGAESVRGSRTERSAAETAPPASPPTQPRSRRRAIVGAALIASVLAAGAVLLMTVGRGERADATSAPPDAERLSITIDAAMVDASLERADATNLVAVPVDAGVPERRRIVRTEEKREAPLATDAAVVTPVRPITIGAEPWAYFTVDDSPTRHETPTTLDLSVGAHRVTFSNPQLGVSRTVTIEVPPVGTARHIERMR